MHISVLLILLTKMASSNSRKCDTNGEIDLPDDLKLKIIFESGSGATVKKYLTVLKQYNKRKASATPPKYEQMQYMLTNCNILESLIAKTWINMMPDTFKDSIKKDKYTSLFGKVQNLLRIFGDLEDKLAHLNKQVINDRVVQAERIDFINAIDTVYDKDRNIFKKLDAIFEKKIKYPAFVQYMLLLYTVEQSNIIFSNLKELTNDDEIQGLDIVKTFRGRDRVIPIVTIPREMGYFIVVVWHIGLASYYSFLLGGSDWHTSMYHLREMQNFLANPYNSKYTSFNKIKITESNVIASIKKLKKLEPSEFHILHNF